jgi:RNA-directed DNA polymerase
MGEGPNEKERFIGGLMTNGRHQMPATAGRGTGRRGEALPDVPSDEPNVPHSEAKGVGSALLQRMLTKENMQRAWKRVKANKGAAGVDGLDIEQTAAQLKRGWPEIKERLLNGTYRPKPVRRVGIPKPDGGERELGIPTVSANYPSPRGVFGMG